MRCSLQLPDDTRRRGKRIFWPFISAAPGAPQGRILPTPAVPGWDPPCPHAWLGAYTGVSAGGQIADTVTAGVSWSPRGTVMISRLSQQPLNIFKLEEF